MSMMKTSLTIIHMCPREHFSLYESLFRLVLCYKKYWATLPHLVTFVTCYPLRTILSQNYLVPIMLVPAENTLLKTACHFLLLLVGFDTRTYRKDYDRSPILVGHHSTLCVFSPQEICQLVTFCQWPWKNGHRSMTIWDQLVKSCSGDPNPKPLRPFWSERS